MILKKKSLWLLSGCPGSGKTTKAKELVISLDDVKYVSRDEIRFSILNAEDEYFAKEADVFNKFVREIQKGIDNYENTIADATFLNWPSRRKLLLKLKNLKEVNVNILQFTTPLDVCLERNEKREGRAKVPEEVIRDMYEKMTHPSKDPFSYYITGEVVSSGESIFN
jgi:tRNA uridine 5-carbamoylmethylation protein Kti12